MAHKTKYISDLRQLSEKAADAALVAVTPGCHQTAVIDASKKLSDIADRIERKNEAAVLVLAENATLDELYNARQKQSVRRGNKVYLPGWRSSARALPDIFLRTALFSSSSAIQKQNNLVISNDPPFIFTKKEIDSFKNVCLIFSGYPLCQYDRQVYATCLDYYRERPLASDYIETSFYEFANKMGSTFNAKTYDAIRASLIRLSCAKLRLRQDSKDVDVPRFLSIKFDEIKGDEVKGDEVKGDEVKGDEVKGDEVKGDEVKGDEVKGDEVKGDEVKGSSKKDLHRFSFYVTEDIAELFGVAAWTAVDNEVVDYSGLKGWIANFYATHSKSMWLPLKSLYRISGYESRFDNFKNSLIKSLDNLKDSSTHEDCRISRYEFSNNKENILVVRAKGERGGK